MVVKPSVLIVGDDKQALVPLRTGSQRFVHFLDKLLPVGNIMRRVVVIRRVIQQIEVPRLDHAQARKLPPPSMLPKRREQMEFGNVLQPAQIPVE